MRTRRLSEILQNSIVAISVGVAISAGGTVYGIANYFHSDAMKRQGELHSIEIEKLKRSQEEQIRETRRNFEGEVDKLNSRISSIDRRLGDQKYLDIQKFFTAQPISGRDFKGQLEYIADGGFLQ